MTCEKIQDKLSPYLDQILSQDEIEDIEKHLKTCPDCRQELLELQKTGTLIRTLPEIPLPADFQQNFHQQLTALSKKEKAGNARRNIWGHRWAPWAMVAILMLAFYPIISSMTTHPRISPAPMDEAGTIASGINETQNSVLMQDLADASRAFDDAGNSRASGASGDLAASKALEQEISQEELRSQESLESKEVPEAGILDDLQENESVRPEQRAEKPTPANKDNTLKTTPRVDKNGAGNKSRQDAPQVDTAKEHSGNTAQVPAQVSAQVVEQVPAQVVEPDALPDQIFMRRAVPEEDPPASQAESYPVDASPEEMNMLMMMPISLDLEMAYQVRRDQYQTFIDRLEKLPATNPHVLEVTQEVTAPEEAKRYFILVAEGKTDQVLALIGETEASISDVTETNPAETIPLTLIIRENQED